MVGGAAQAHVLEIRDEVRDGSFVDTLTLAQDVQLQGDKTGHMRR